MCRRQHFMLLAMAACLLAMVAEADKQQALVEEGTGEKFIGKAIGAAAVGAAAYGISKLFKGKKGLAYTLKPDDLSCVACQYFVERVRGEMLVNGLGGGMPMNGPNGVVGVPRFSAGQIVGANTVGSNPYLDNPQTFMTPPVSGAGAGAAGEGAAGAEGAEAGAETPPPAFLETEEEVGVQGNNIVAKVNAFIKKQGGNSKTGMVPPSRRLIATVLRYFRPAQARYANMFDGPLKAAKRAQERHEENMMYSAVYSAIEKMCGQETPVSFLGYCMQTLHSYNKVAEGLRYKDRPGQICMSLQMCSKKSYLMKGAHEKLEVPKFK